MFFKTSLALCLLNLEQNDIGFVIQDQILCGILRVYILNSLIHQKSNHDLHFQLFLPHDLNIDMEGMGQLLNINNYIFTYLLNSLKKNVQALYYYNLLLDRDWNKNI